jgi:hypothetical protein
MVPRAGIEPATLRYSENVKPSPDFSKHCIAEDERERAGEGGVVVVEGMDYALSGVSVLPR